ncbi:MAG: Multidrug resistance protein MdtB [Fimbriimonadaceae bacterium]|nr:Multidrug resistance protein MdtB [Fimbriimonadaceae bacterium]
MKLTLAAINRPVFILMLMCAAIMMGTIAYRSMRVEQNPDVTFGTITVTTIYPGAGPDEVSTLVSRRIEEAISGVNGLREVTSSSQEGVSMVFAQFLVGIDMDAALNEVRAKVDGIADNLPTQARKPVLERFDSGSDPVMYMVVRSQSLDAQQLRDLADDKLKDRFSRINGVASVGVNGGDVREIQVRIKKDKLLSYKLGITDVQRALLAATINVPSGRVTTPTEEYSVRVLGEFKSAAEIENMRLTVFDQTRQGGKGTPVRLGDVATVVDTVAERRNYSRLNGSDTVVMTLQKAKTGNAIEIAREAEQVLKQIESDYGLEIVVTLNQAETISESLFDLNFTLFFGIFLVTLIVYLFLHNLRGTIIVGIAIPVCLFATFIVLWALGFTINNMSMLALSLAIGVLVDDAIVVLENIYRHLRMGEDPKEAAVNGRSEIGLAAIAITLADVVVFVPIAFMGGVVGQFFRPLGIGFAVTVLFSLFVSFTVTPMLASRWYREGEDLEHPTGRFARWFEHSFERLADRYRRALEWALRHRWFVFLSGFCALVGVFMAIGGSFAPDYTAAFSSAVPLVMVCVAIGVVAVVVNLLAGNGLKMMLPFYGLLFGLVFPGFAVAGHAYRQWKGDNIFNFQFFPQADNGSVSASVELPPGSTLPQTQAVIERIERAAMKHNDVKYVLSNVGSRGGGFQAGDQGTNYGQVTITLNDKMALLDRITFWKKHEEKLRTRSDIAVAADLLEAVGTVPGAQINIAASNGFGFGSPIQMSFASENRDLLVKTVTDIKQRLQAGAIQGVINPEISSKPGKPEFRAIPDRVRMADAGVTVADIANTMRMMYEGNEDVKFRVQGREYNIRTMLDLEDRNNPRIIDQLPVAFEQGNPIFLSQVAKIEEGVGLDKIERRSRIQEIQVTAGLLPGKAAGTVQAEINTWLEKENLVPEGVRKVELGQAQIQAQESGYLFGALFMGFILVYMLLASLYDNLLYPFIIQLAQPQAMVGALLALIFTDKALNIVGFIGIITLVGLVGKNAILLVDYTNTLRERGRNRHDALVEAGPIRLRPIMMTSLAVVLGMLPVALAIGRGSEFRETIGITIIGGVILSTALTLLIIPCSYTIFDDLSLAIGRLFRRMSGRGKGGPTDDDTPSGDGRYEGDMPESEATVRS